MTKPGLDNTTTDVVCPFCGLLCDDLTVTVSNQGELTRCENACDRGRDGFAQACQPLDNSECWIDGKPATLTDACRQAMNILMDAKTAAVGGMMTDVTGARAAMALAERAGAIVDHATSNALLRNQRVMQRSGWFTTTLTEIRNRADLVVLVGDGIPQRFPRLMERVLCPSQALHDDRLQTRRIVTLGSQPLTGEITATTDHIACSMEQLYPTLNRLRRAVSHGATPSQSSVTPSRVNSDNTIEQLAAHINASQYAVFIWSAGLLDDSDADLVIDAVCQLVRDRNETGRCAGFPIAGNDGDITANQVCTWQTGFGLRTAFIDGAPVHDSVAFDTTALIHEEQLDALLWIASLTTQQPPPTQQATGLKKVVLGHPALANKHEEDVFIAVETPGVGTGGLMVRADVVVSLPLSAVRPARLPSVAEVIASMMDHAPT